LFYFWRTGEHFLHISLSDRIKIARNASGDEINLSIQYILNCAGGVAGRYVSNEVQYVAYTIFVLVQDNILNSYLFIALLPIVSCHGGSHTGVYQFVKSNGFVPYDTCQPYLACR